MSLLKNLLQNYAKLAAAQEDGNYSFHVTLSGFGDLAGFRWKLHKED